MLIDPSESSCFLLEVSHYLEAHKDINGNLQITLNISKVSTYVLDQNKTASNGLTKMSSFFLLAGVISFLHHSRGDLSNFTIPRHGYINVYNIYWYAIVVIV